MNNRILNLITHGNVEQFCIRLIDFDLPISFVDLLSRRMIFFVFSKKFLLPLSPSIFGEDKG